MVVQPKARRQRRTPVRAAAAFAMALGLLAAGPMTHAASSDDHRVGNDGRTGPQERVGNNGPTGPQGHVGNTAPTGPRGRVGNNGPTGPQRF